MTDGEIERAVAQVMERIERSAELNAHADPRVRLADVIEQTGQPVIRAGRARFVELLEHCEARVPSDGRLLGDYSVADPYLAVMVLWARHIRVAFDAFPRLGAWFGRFAQRPAFMAVLRAEGVIDASGKPTPPARV